MFVVDVSNLYCAKQKVAVPELTQKCCTVAVFGRYSLGLFKMHVFKMKTWIHTTGARWVGRKSGPIFRRLWTEVHQIYI